jgi:hypothetical protein
LTQASPISQVRAASVSCGGRPERGKSLIAASSASSAAPRAQRVTRGD